ncbi:hypothetical protein JCGZ_11034 [Jatropha curcas]|uniref:Uncharacterized protein n=1 Tax=Jatropha curcas TaxID=180498 RepID=A0A067KT95_JATCU|nr:hypothetical protein JCGZ_11034 [Jatropha curcas]
MASSDFSDQDFLGSLEISLNEVDLMADAASHASMTGIFAQDSRIKLDVGPSRAPQAILEASGPLHPDLANLRLPYSISYFVPDSPPALREVSLKSVDRLTLPSEDITEVPVGLVNQMMELVLGMQQELAAAWTQIAFDDSFFFSALEIIYICICM